jgi:hypothetical protein
VQNLAPAGFVLPQLVHAVSAIGCAGVVLGGMFTGIFNGWPHAGIAIPKAAAIPAA